MFLFQQKETANQPATHPREPIKLHEKSINSTTFLMYSCKLIQYFALSLSCLLFPRNKPRKTWQTCLQMRRIVSFVFSVLGQFSFFLRGMWCGSLQRGSYCEKMPNFHNFHDFSEHWNYHQTAHTVPGKSLKRKEKSVLMGEKEKSAYCLYCRRRGSSTTPVCLIMVPLVLKSNIEF